LLAFLADRPQAKLLDALCTRYHVRPSAVLRGDWSDADIDIAVMLAALADDPGLPASSAPLADDMRPRPLAAPGSGLSRLMGAIPGVVVQGG